MRILASLLTALLLTAGPAGAQTSNTDMFKEYIASDAHREMVKRAIATIPPRILPRCPTLVSNASRIIPMKSLSIGPDGTPNTGAWKQEFPVSGCGPATSVNLFFAATPGKGIDVVVGLLGTTHADPLLQREAIPLVRIGAGRVTSICPEIAVAHAEFEHMGRSDGTPPPAAPPGKQAWWETWTLTGCGLTVDLVMEFAPDATGTQILQPSSGAHLR